MTTDDRHWSRTDYRAEIARLRADLESERQLSADYNEEIVAAHDDRDRYRAEIARLQSELTDLRTQLLAETYRPEGGEIVLAELGRVKADNKRLRAVADAARALVARISAEGGHGYAVHGLTEDLRTALDALDRGEAG